MMPARTVDVAVVGRGAVGAAAALGCAQAGLSVCWIGPNATPPSPADTVNAGWDARVFALSPATRELLRRLRIWDALPSSRIAPVYDMRVFSGAKTDAPELHLDAYSGRVDALAWIVENRVLSRTLEGAAGFAGVLTVNGTVESFEPPASAAGGHVRLTIAGAAAVQARLVIAADGADSSLRAMAGIEPSIREYGQRAVVANFDAHRPHADTAWQWFDAQLGVLALLPLPADSASSGRVSMVWSAPEPLAGELCSLSHAELAQRVTQASQGLLGDLTVITPPQAFDLRLVRVPRFIAPHLVLVGDAAHVIHPLAGQGMNLGFGDVAQLLDVLKTREPHRDLADPLLWRRYERARREAVTMMQTTTDGLQRLFGDVPEPLARLRDLGWRAVARSGWMRQRLVAHAVR